MKTLRITLFLTCLFGHNFSSRQGSDQSFQQNVLKKAITDSTFITGKWTTGGGTETHLKYLGKFTTAQGQTFKILNSTNFWGLSHRAASKILVFDGNNKYAGNYPVAMTTDLPVKLENGKLIFKNEAEDCDKNLITVIDLKKGLPEKIFRQCKGQYGDIYSFEKYRPRR